VTSIDLLSKYLLIMELRFGVMLYSNLGNENFDAGHIKCPRGPQVSPPCFNTTCFMAEVYSRNGTRWEVRVSDIAQNAFSKKVTPVNHEKKL